MPRSLSRRAPYLLLLTLSALALPGCPIYDDDARECHDALDCLAGYRCDLEAAQCVRRDAASCERPADCEPNETCAESGECITGDCSFDRVGCVSGYECSRSSGIWKCIPEGSAPAAGGSTSAGGSTNSAGSAGSGGSAGTAGSAGSGGSAGTAGSAGGGGSSGDGGSSGSAGSGGSSVSNGDAGQGGVADVASAGQAGATASAGAPPAGASGEGGALGDAGASGAAGNPAGGAGS